MAYVNVADWKPDQVADWLKGLDVSIHRYVESFLNNHVNGQHLLNLQPDDLEHHGICKVGHQEIILEAVDHLRNFHYELDHENLQLLALRVSCLAHSLHRELWNYSSPVVSTQTLSDVATIIKAVKPLVCWLDRPPFSGQLAFIDKKAELLRLSLEMAFSGQRGKFADHPIENIRNSAKGLSELADEMIREIHDPLLLQPSSLDLATLKKRPGEHLGFCIIPSFHGIHQIGDIKCNSTAYQSGKIECGDEIVQINYQTVVGWDVKQVMALFEESSSDIFLTLKKRPCHSKILGQIYMKPYRLPSKKQVSYRWFLDDKITPPRISHFDIKPLGHALVNSVTSFTKNRKPLSGSFENAKEDVSIDIENQNKSIQKEEPEDDLEDDDDDDEDNEPEEEEESISSPTSVRLYHPKPRLPVQRRATITGTGASPTSKRAPLNLEQLWHELKLEKEWRLSGKQRKGEKSTSELLLSATSPSEVGSDENKIHLKSAPKACSADCLKSVQSDFVRRNKPDLNLLDSKFIAENEIPGKSLKETDQESKKVNDPSLTEEESNMFIPLKERIEIFNKKIDDSNSVHSMKPKVPAKRYVQNEGFISLTNSPAHRPTEKKPVARPRGKLDKSNSTPVYDFNDRPQGADEIELLLSRELKSRINIPASTRNEKPEAQGQILQTEVDDKKHSCDSSESVSVSTSTSSPFQTIVTLSNKSPDLKKKEMVLSVSHSSQDKSSIDVPKPAVRTFKKDTRNLVSDSDIKTRNVYSTDMHISDSKDSVFMEDDVSPSATGAPKHCLSPDKKAPNDTVAIEHGISTINISNTTQKIKFIDDPESPTYSFNNKDPVPAVKPREFNSASNARHVETQSFVNVSKSESLVPSSPPLSIQESPVILSKINDGPKKDPITASGHLPQTKELLLNKVSVGSSSKISYTPENTVQVTIPHSPSTWDDQVRNFPKPSTSKINLTSSSSAEAVNKVQFASSTPIKKQYCQETSFCQQSSTYPRNKPEVKSVLPGPSSIQNSPLRAIIPLKPKHKGTSPKVFRKKTNLLRGKRRNISVKDLVMPDCEGWLFQRDRKISTVPQWIRGWFIIKGNHFYGFTDKDSTKAHLFIYLPGFTVAPAVEVKSRKYALKIYHTGTTFYLSADSQDEFSSWLGCLSQATIAHDRSPVENITFSESEGEEKSSDKSDSDKSKDHCFSSPKVKKMSNFLTGPLTSSSSKHEKKFSSLKKKKEDNHHKSDHGNSSLDRKYLRFLSGTNNVPVPTEHFRSYRRVAPGTLSDKLPSHDSSMTSMESTIARTSSPPLQLPPDMADYRLASLARAGHTTNVQREHNTTLEAFMMSRQGEERRQNQSTSALRPPQQFAPSVPNSQLEDAACRTHIMRQSHPSTSHKESECGMSNVASYGWSEPLGASSTSRNCNTIPDIQTKRLKKIATVNSNVHQGACVDSNSLSELEDSSDRSHFQRNTTKSSSSSKLKSFFSTSHWQDSSSKTLLGSPRLRRVLFREKSDASNRGQASKSHPTSNSHNESSASGDLGQHTPDYPGLEYPPVFVEESYSLSYVTSILEARASPSSNNPHDSETASNDGDDNNEPPV
ncbi:hypothetical protein M8J76_014220 [Diaphorina citri]|nr:hypothetical protein M8J75_012624 [Diaphorina citri]KAI5750267.1 hypothetical protein M8J76_014220 [Diaphorina citri]KAI5755108.1 hypothetical protein M8J77_014226 [Diaphorina citri]